jgi:hypothetical protein
MKPRKNPAAVALGRLGGQAGTGKAKARTSEQARAAALARWSRITRKDTANLTVRKMVENLSCAALPNLAQRGASKGNT